MTDLAEQLVLRNPHRSPAAEQRLRRRYAAELRFKLYGMAAVGIGLLALAFLLASVLVQGLPAFRQTSLRLDIAFDAATLDPQGTRDPAVLAAADYRAPIRDALLKAFPEVEGRAQRRQLTELVSGGADLTLRSMVLENPAILGTTQPVWLLADDRIDQVMKGGVDRNLPETERPISDRQLEWLDRLQQQGAVELRFNPGFLTSGNSREAEQAGIGGAVAGSLLTLLVTFVLSFPVAVAAAVYLEEFAPRNRLTGLIEVNINNLAAVPSIVFGLLGLAMLIGVFGMPRSTPLVGGTVLALMTLPTIIIASRSALKAVPPSIREAALGMGASKLQVVAHHVLPLAMPGIMTGTIIGMARALGETAPLLIIGMVAFIVDIPGSLTDSATVLPVQIFLWADTPERAFSERTSGAILVLLAFLIAMNALAVLLRRKFERRW